MNHLRKCFSLNFVSKHFFSPSTALGCRLLHVSWSPQALLKEWNEQLYMVILSPLHMLNILNIFFSCCHPRDIYALCPVGGTVVQWLALFSGLNIRSVCLHGFPPAYYTYMHFNKARSLVRIWFTEKEKLMYLVIWLLWAIIAWRNHSSDLGHEPLESGCWRGWRWGLRSDWLRRLSGGDGKRVGCMSVKRRMW